MKMLFKTFPLSTNSLYAHVGRRRFLTKAARENKEVLAWEARAQFKGLPTAGLLSVKLYFFWPNARNHDVDNVKSLLDALTGIVWMDDGQITELYIHKTIDKANPRLEVEVDKYRPR